MRIGALVFAAALLLLAVWGVRLVRAVMARRRALEELARVEARGDARERVIAEQRATDRELTVRRLTRWLPLPGRRSDASPGARS